MSRPTHHTPRRHCRASYTARIGAMALVAAWAAGGNGEPPATQPVIAPAALVAWSGPQCNVTERATLRIDAHDAWVALWRRALPDTSPRDHLEHPLVPEVDFGRCTVLACFDGAGWNANGLVLVSVEELEAVVRVRIDKRSYQTSGMGPGGGRVPVTPYGLFVVPKLPRDGRPVVVEQNVQNLIGGPAVWRERARL
ncbi:MAG: hypothetical protein IPM18_01425 [Phycisphaerales bacterium]|nr:hypothetical protein [Phycisphaerales bacterium]